MTTAEDLAAQLAKDYENNTLGEALFYNSTDNSCFRFEVANLGYRCSYGDLDQGVVGYYIQGTFYYHKDEFDGSSPKLPSDKTTKATFSVEQVQNKNKNTWYAHVKFYEPGSTTKLLGEFLGEDDANAVGSSGLNNDSETAKWKEEFSNDLEDDLNDSYDNADSGAEALFFMSVYNAPSLRLEIPSQGWEFTYGTWVGPDPQGTFHYNDGIFGGNDPKLQSGEETKTYFYMKQIKNKKGVIWAHIRFFAPGSKTQLLGEFLGEDRHNETAGSGLLQVLTQGTWKEGSSAVANGTTASKDKNSTTITITCKPEDKKATITCNTTDTIYGESISTHGRLTARDFKDVKNAKLVRWYHDLVVFYEDTNSTDWSAFFFPAPDTGSDPLGTDTAEKDWNGVTWVDT